MEICHEVEAILFLMPKETKIQAYKTMEFKPPKVHLRIQNYKECHENTKLQGMS
jgi:hypothetical protein